MVSAAGKSKLVPAPSLRYLRQGHYAKVLLQLQYLPNFECVDRKGNHAAQDARDIEIRRTLPKTVE